MDGRVRKIHSWRKFTQQEESHGGMTVAVFLLELGWRGH